ncbi:transcription initiation factor TFIID subunit 6-like [Physella acuta]|uniref:transcription initiation factor TFIID subunit 6-like n=1 Tax=Physella acuta TaxID=109671 RepID=UPI0027DDA5F4|nr:transcription initiation factor TFIID subunit 6-like [Physella acuta]XP_059167585.1 transcription initiation factor TFIID subunit 6-like [Physella acuta]
MASESRFGSILSSESIRVIAESIGISGLADEASSFLAEDISYRLKLVVQEAEKLRQHGKRLKLMCTDFDQALQMKNVEPVYGHTSKEGNIPFRHASGGGREIYFTEEKEVDLHAVVSDPLPKIPIEVSLKAHWLSIEGTQPALPENPPPASKDLQKQEILDTAIKTGANRPLKRPHPDSNKHKHHHKHKESVMLKNLATHELSVEQQFYYKEITESCVGPDEQKRSEALQSLQCDPGLHQMLPRFVAFASEGVKINAVQNNLALLIYLMRMVKSLLDNQTIYLDKYLHDLLPTVMTCVVSRQLCLRPDMDNHWALRDFAARLVAQICRNYSNNTNNIQARVTKKFSKAIQSEAAALATIYGALAGLGELGPEVIKSCLLPYICILGDRIKAVNEGTALNVDKIAAEHIKRQLLKYLPPVLKTFHNSTENVDEFNVAYGYLGPLMFSMFLQKEKSLTATTSAIHALAAPRSTLQLSQRPPQIVIQQQPNTPVPLISSPFLNPSPSLTSLNPRPLPSMPSTPTGIPGQKFVIVSQARPSTPIAPPTQTTPLVKFVTTQQSSLTTSNAPGTQKIVVIQGSSTKTEDSSVGGIRTAVLSGVPSTTVIQQPATTTLNTNISGNDTL